jgi:O-acetylserine/cysteine efflux transporter
VSAAADQPGTPVPARWIWLGVAIAFIWGFNFVVADEAVSEVSPLLLVGLRYAILGVLFLPFTSRGGIPWKYLIAVGLLSGVFQFGGLFLGLKLGVSAGVASVALQSQALFTVVFATFSLGERYKPRQWFGLVLGAAGLVAVAAGAGSVPIGGLLCVLGGGAGWAAANIVLRKAGSVSAWSMTVWQAVVVVPALLVLSLVFEDGQVAEIRHMSLKTASAVLYIALVSTALSNVLWYRTIQHIGASRTAPFSLLVPVFGVAFSMILLGEDFSVVEILGVVVTMLGLAVINLRFRKLRARREAAAQAAAPAAEPEAAQRAGADKT